MIVAQVIVIASLAEVAAQYTFSLFGINVIENPVIPIQVGEVTFDVGVVALGILFVAGMTWICWRGIELSARTQAILLTVELFTLGLFAVVALVKVFGGLEGSVMPTLEWLNPLSIVGEDGGWDSSAFAAALLVTLFIYWGWDTTASVNEESGNPTEQPGRATVYSVLILVGTYLLVTIAAQAIHGAEYLAEQGESDILASLGAEILGEPLNVLLIIAVLTSSAASTQTTILPCARTALSMGAKGAAPKYWAQIHPRYLTPANATIWTGILAVLWYIGLKLISENVYWDALTALGLMIAFYYGITGYASVIYYRKVLFRSVKDFVGMGLLPLFGAVVLTWAFWQSVIDLMSPLSSYTCTDPEDVATCASLFGLGVPLALSILLGILGVILLVAWRLKAPEFFARKREVFQPEPEVAA
jgi:amino acid transporter